MAFRKVWKNRHQLQGLFNPFNENPFEGTVTTEVDVTTYARQPPATSPPPKNDAAEPAIPGIAPPTADKPNDFDPYTVNVEVGPDGPQTQPSAAPDLFRVRTLTRAVALSETNPEAWLYARVAFLFFLALLISWVPSSVNRLYALANPADYNFGLNYTEALVLPLQGFWNAVVYVVTSRRACGDLWRGVVRGGRAGGGNDGSGSGSGNGIGIGAVGMGEGRLDRFAGGLGSKKGDTRLERFTSRRTSQRLESDDSSVLSLRGH